ncbi:MAG: SigE family RNA polymerase sigma factor [Geodermatophilaceae bacterium]|nr:SigE family RNA polymerase sigma factor [Geodermatophilaceae bacterium]
MQPTGPTGRRTPVTLTEVRLVAESVRPAVEHPDVDTSTQLSVDLHEPFGPATRDFSTFYANHVNSLTAQIFALTGSWPEAQDAVQEGFARALARWSTVSGHADPVAWVRTVSHRVAISRWRRARTALAFGRTQRVQTTPGPNEDHVALIDGLKHLPHTQREALVLFYLADLSIEAIASQLDIPTGTVKARLSRGRTALAAQLKITTDEEGVDHA